MRPVLPGSLLVMALALATPAGAQPAGTERTVTAPLPPKRPASAAPRPAPPERSPSKPSVSRPVPPETPQPESAPAPAATKPEAAPPASPAKPAEPAAASDGPALSECLRRLTAEGHRLQPVAAKDLAASAGDCRVEEPVRVERLAVRRPDGPGTLVLEPPPLVACEMARAMAHWADTALVPLARGAMNQELIALRVGGGHECRRRNRQARTPMSEHATGRALDIFAFRFAGEGAGSEIMVAKPGGLVQERFLAGARQAACGAFSTVLGPGSDAAHADHLHLDIQRRGSGRSRFCQ
ncbi:extensin family protein [Bosea sp. TWI1241]|uniref:extensin-like domain-containing protein n=1 Tax=Bosea sp. TWI1241 TaxID=3148904 RepID=UPI0032087AEF